MNHGFVKRAVKSEHLFFLIKGCVGCKVIGSVNSPAPPPPLFPFIPGFDFGGYDAARCEVVCDWLDSVALL